MYLAHSHFRFPYAHNNFHVFSIRQNESFSTGYSDKNNFKLSQKPLDVTQKLKQSLKLSRPRHSIIIPNQI